MKNSILKSTVAFVLILALAIPVFALPSSATSGKALTIEEANEIIEKAVKLIDYTFNMIAADRYGSDLIVYEKTETGGNREIVKNFEVNGQEVEYCLMDESQLLGGSIEKMVELASTVYTEDLVSTMSDKALYYRGKQYDAYPLFQRDGDGKLYCCSPRIPYYWIDANRSAENEENVPPTKLITKFVESSNTAAVVLVGVHTNSGDERYWIECKLTNTSQGWRICDSDFVKFSQTLNDMSNSNLLVPRTEGESAAPNTADASFEQIVMLTVVATLSLVAVPFVLSRKRRAI